MHPYRSSPPATAPSAKRWLSRRASEVLWTLMIVGLVATYQVLSWPTAERSSQGVEIAMAAIIALQFALLVAHHVFARRIASWRLARVERLADEWLAALDEREPR